MEWWCPEKMWAAVRCRRKRLQENERARHLHRASTLLAHTSLTLYGSGAADRTSACIPSYVQLKPSVMAKITFSRHTAALEIILLAQQRFMYHRTASPIRALHAAIMWGSK